MDIALGVIRVSIERFFMERGELFVDASSSGSLVAISTEDIRRISSEELAKRSAALIMGRKDVESIAICVELLLATPTERVAAYLRRISDAYTLRAFLRQTPDVQEAVRKMFSVGEIWLDTSVVLPMFGEGLLPGGDRTFRGLLAAAANAGLVLRVTPGVVEEVERHINRAKVCANTPSAAWQGPIPYLLSVYVYRGYDPALFADWVSQFAGQFRPEDDLAEYLLREFRISRTDIDEDARRAPHELRMEVQRLWQEIHTERSQRQVGRDPMVALRMAQHDVENYVGVIVRRNKERDSAVGYTSWWLTLDHQAFSLAKNLPRHVLGTYQSPVMSADYLANYLAVGPLRAANAGYTLPVMIDALTLESLDRSLFDLAQEIRKKNTGQPEALIRRRVRDELDQARRRTGNVHDQGLDFTRDIG